nr:hypothetical protein BHI3_19060 [Bacteriovorax sp. HI3]
MDFRRYLIISIFAFTCSCSTIYKNEHQHYLGIKSAMAKDRYSLAVKEIMEFKDKYPESNYLCELLPIQIAWKKDRNMDASKEESEFTVKCRK